MFSNKELDLDKLGIDKNVILKMSSTLLQQLIVNKTHELIEGDAAAKYRIGIKSSAFIFKSVAGKNTELSEELAILFLYTKGVIKEIIDNPIGVFMQLLLVVLREDLLSIYNLGLICDIIRASGGNPLIMQELEKRKIKILKYPGSSFTDDKGFILIFNDWIYIESHNKLFEKKEIESSTGKKYIGKIIHNGETNLVIEIDCENYYYLEFSTISILHGGIQLSYGIIQDGSGFYGMIHIGENKVYELSALGVMQSGSGTIRFILTENPYTFIDYDGKSFGEVQKAGEIFPRIGGEESAYITEIRTN